MLTALTRRTVGSLQLGAGVFLIGLDLDRASSAYALRVLIAEALKDDAQTLGMTTGGGWFRCIPALRSPAEEAGRPPTVDDALLDGWLVTLTGTLIELTPERMARMLPGTTIRRTGRVGELLPGATIGPDEYFPRVCWVGDTTSGLVAIELTNAINVAGAAFHFVERGEGSMPFEFRAHQNVGDGSAPCRVVFLEE